MHVPRNENQDKRERKQEDLIKSDREVNFVNNQRGEMSVFGLVLVHLSQLNYEQPSS